jgi:hypothetical protein
MTRPVRYPYVSVVPGPGQAGRAPYLPLALTLGTVRVDLFGLLDTGAAANVLPHSVGLQLGADWARQTIPVPLGGVLTGAQGRALVVTGAVGPFPPVPLFFARVDTDVTPVILGQTNFFREFDVCFYGSRSEFDIRPAASTTP